ncbi:MAG: hypothetical protein SV775_17865 [Thermodesulfobacteriota bacterium]|nr:hypothetical protein [Thermodesulfobacteriota bacterium]
MTTCCIETTDMFRGAFFLCKGGDLTDVRIRNNGKPIASFLITGNHLDQLDKDYLNGDALVNPVQYRESLNRLRDILFENLRQNEGRYHNDRKRKDRKHQKHR